MMYQPVHPQEMSHSPNPSYYPYVQYANQGGGILYGPSLQPYSPHSPHPQHPQHGGPPSMAPMTTGPHSHTGAPVQHTGHPGQYTGQHSLPIHGTGVPVHGSQVGSPYAHPGYTNCYTPPEEGADVSREAGGTGGGMGVRQQPLTHATAA